MLFENIYKEKFGDGAFLDIDLVQQSGLGVKCTSNSKGEDAKVVFKPIYLYANTVLEVPTII